MKYVAILIVFFSSACIMKQPITDFGKEFQTNQLVVVTAHSWTSVQGTLSFFERNAQNKWTPICKDIPVTVGRNGMAWGKGLHPDQLNTGTLKHEGDGKSPAGIFKLTALFSYGKLESTLEHIQSDSTWFCVDDANSSNYNQIVTTRNTAKDWYSAEDMKRQDELYKFGVVVAYNTDPVRKGDGSCIFLHIWRSASDATAGCTAMKESDLLKVIQTLDKAKNPVLVQMPVSEYAQLKKRYSLP